uniref:CC domain-containing protein n=1 Tax=Caenorhabditis tropicalis TaxID=1561998 RepID=A0A1I7TPU2_9PELO
MHFLIFAFCFFIGLQSVINESVEIKELRRFRRQLYLCGTQPYQYYSPNPCPTIQSCPNGGLFMNVPCQQSYQCTPYYSGVSSCINGFCCTSPNNQNNPIQITTTTTTRSPSGFGVCPSGQLSEVRCTTRGQCASGQTCIGGLCCTTTGNEWNVACGGQAALGSCDFSSRCISLSQVCTSSNYCCECPYGQSYGTCGNGICPSGFSCQANGNCCPVCPNNQPPFGSCVAGQCGGGRTCRSGNICC